MTVEKIRRASDKRLRDQITRELKGLDTRVTQNESDIDDLEAADVVHNEKLDEISAYRPAMMLLDGSSGYYSSSPTTSGNAVTCVFRFRGRPLPGVNQRIVTIRDSGARQRLTILLFSSDNADADRAGKLACLCASNTGTNIAFLFSNSAVNINSTSPKVGMFSYDATAGTAQFIVDGVDVDDTGNADRVLTTGTLASGAGTMAVGANNIGPTDYFNGQIGFFGYRDAYLTNWDDFFNSDGTILYQQDESGWTQWGAQPTYWNPHGQMNNNLGSAGNMTANGTIKLWMPGFSDSEGLVI